MKSGNKNRTKKKSKWKQKMIDEMIEYFINVVYLSLFFGTFAWYRRLILAQHQIDYLSYGVGIIEALILAKVIMFGNLIGLGKKLKNKPLILTVLYQSIVFIIWASFFTLVEYGIRGVFKGESFMNEIEKFLTKDRNEFFARTLVTFLAFVPFFAFKEIQNIVGREKIKKLFYAKSISKVNE